MLRGILCAPCAIAHLHPSATLKGMTRPPGRALPPLISPVATWTPFGSQLCPLFPLSRQSAKIFLQSSELGLPHPLTRRRVCYPTFGSMGATLACGKRGVGGAQFQRGDRHCGTLGKYVLCAYSISFWYTNSASSEDLSSSAAGLFSALPLSVQI
jgi:hypothetical protein